jgi:hypothetical protein
MRNYVSSSHEAMVVTETRILTSEPRMVSDVIVDEEI